MNKVLIVGGGKGGVGKTTVTIALVDALVTDGQDVLLVESDDSNPDAWKALNGLVRCEVCNLDNEGGYIALGNLIEANPKSVVVVNTGARATASLIEFGGIVKDVCQAMKRNLTIVWPINRQRDCIELLNDLIADKLIDNRLALSNADDKLSIAEKSVLGRYRTAAKKAIEACYV